MVEMLSVGPDMRCLRVKLVVKTSMSHPHMLLNFSLNSTRRWSPSGREDHTDMDTSICVPTKMFRPCACCCCCCCICVLRYQSWASSPYAFWFRRWFSSARLSSYAVVVRSSKRIWSGFKEGPWEVKEGPKCILSSDWGSERGSVRGSLMMSVRGGTCVTPWRGGVSGTPSSSSSSSSTGSPPLERVVRRLRGESVQSKPLARHLLHGLSFPQPLQS